MPVAVTVNNDERLDKMRELTALMEDFNGRASDAYYARRRFIVQACRAGVDVNDIANACKLRVETIQALHGSAKHAAELAPRTGYGARERPSRPRREPRSTSLNT